MPMSMSLSGCEVPFARLPNSHTSRTVGASGPLPDQLNAICGKVHCVPNPPPPRASPLEQPSSSSEPIGRAAWPVGS